MAQVDTCASRASGGEHGLNYYSFEINLTKEDAPVVMRK
jgi:hypothetical protein